MAAMGEAEGVETLYLADDAPYPNNPSLPVVLLRAAFPHPDPATIEATFAAHGWSPAWRYGVFDFHHYHATAHEALGCFRGSGDVQLGGPEGPVVTIEAGDVAVLPAGTAHKGVDSRGRFVCVGAYPTGQSPDMAHGHPDERPAAGAAIAHVPLPSAGPVYGSDGPVMAAWLPS